MVVVEINDYINNNEEGGVAVWFGLVKHKNDDMLKYKHIKTTQNDIII